MAASAEIVNSLMVALTSQSRGNSVADMLNKGEAAGLGTHIVAGAIVGTNVSQTVDFGSLRVGDQIVMIPAVAGTTIFYTCATLGTLPVAGVVGNLYVVLRAINLPAASVVKF